MDWSGIVDIAYMEFVFLERDVKFWMLDSCLRQFC